MKVSTIQLAFPPAAKAHIPSELRWEVWERDNFTCRGCGVRRNLAVDHKIPESMGGQMVLDNLQTLCKSCNARKGSLTEIQSGKRVVGWNPYDWHLAQMIHNGEPAEYIQQCFPAVTEKRIRYVAENLHLFRNLGGRDRNPAAVHVTLAPS